MKTQLDIYRSAAEAAFNTLDLKTRLEVDQAKLDAAKTASVSALDYESWSNTFNQSRDMYLQLQSQKCASAIAAENTK